MDSKKHSLKIDEKIKGVQAVDIITGEADLIVTVRAKSIDDLESLVLEKIQSVDCIVKTWTILSLHEFMHD